MKSRQISPLAVGSVTDADIQAQPNNVGVRFVRSGTLPASRTVDADPVMTGAEVVSRLSEVQDHYRELSTELTLADWLGRRRGDTYLDNLMRLTATLQ